MQKNAICIDGRLLGQVQGTGVAHYAQAVVAALRSVGAAPLILDDASSGRFGQGSGPIERGARWLAAWSGHARPARFRAGEGVLRGGDLFRLAHAHFARRGALLRVRADHPAGVMHWTYPVPLRLEGWRNFYTVHDVIPLTDPAYSEIDAAALRRRIELILAAGDRVVTVSESARRDILANLPAAADQVSSAGSAVWGLDDAGAALPAGLPSGGYFLHVGLVTPRKNLDRLIDGWQASGTARPLAIVGPTGHAGSGLDARCAATRGIVRLPHQPRAVLVALMRHARALLFPSLAEGFGLPVAEAMALGTPVLTARGGALEETAGGAALLVDPRDVAAMAAAIARLAADDALCADLRASGLARAGAFALDGFGRRLLAVYAGAAPGGYAAASPSVSREHHIA